MKRSIHPIRFFSRLKWLDGCPLQIEPYRQKILTDGLFTFDTNGRRKYNLVVTGRGKKNYKTFDRILAGIYSLMAWDTTGGNDCYLIDNDLDQSANALDLAKKFIAENPVLKGALVIKQNVITRKDGKGFLKILPAQDIAGSHGTTYLFCGFGEIHAYRDYGLFEAMQLDPHRPDAMMWIESYDSLYHRQGVPLYDLVERGFAGKDKRMLFSWYSANKCTDPEFQDLPPEQRANPSMESWESDDYLEQQRERLPSHQYRRLHLNVGGQPEGSAFAGEKIDRCIERGVHVRHPVPGVNYFFFFDGSVGSNDDQVLAITHREDGRVVLDLIVNQQARPPFDPMKVIPQFAEIVRRYGGSRVVGDRLAFNIFENAWRAENISYVCSDLTAHQLYEQMQVALNTESVVLLDDATLEGQFLSLIWRAGKIDHVVGEHDDWSNACSGAVYFAGRLAPYNPNAVPRPIGSGFGAELRRAGLSTMGQPNPFSSDGRLSHGIPTRQGFDDDD